MKNKENVTIKSVTNCPTCNSECKVNSGTTQYYVPVKKYTEEDMLNASKYGYEFRDTTSFPKHKFEDSCINNTKQWLEWYKNKQD
jgi:hypothetical protein